MKKQTGYDFLGILIAVWIRESEAVFPFLISFFLKKTTYTHRHIKISLYSKMS